MEGYNTRLHKEEATSLHMQQTSTPTPQANDGIKPRLNLVLTQTPFPAVTESEILRYECPGLLCCDIPFQNTILCNHSKK